MRDMVIMANLKIIKIPVLTSTNESSNPVNPGSDNGHDTLPNYSKTRKYLHTRR